MDYEKLHKDTIAKLQEMVNSGKITVKTACGICADFVPESEDERIRKELIEYHGGILNGEDVELPSKEMMERWIAWLEKQCEKETLCDKCKKSQPSHSCQDITALGRCAVEHEQKSDDKIEPKFKVGQTIKKEGFNLGFTIVKIEDDFYYNDMGDYFPFTDQDNWELVEQTSAWSEEDEKILNLIIARLHSHPNVEAEEYGKDYHWIKSLKDRVQPQPKQEWSEKDEVCLGDAVWAIEQARTIAKDENDMGNLWHAERWLKSLRPQSHWKPSDEQMKALKEAVDEHFDIDGGALWHLYEDLKKLK